MVWYCSFGVPECPICKRHRIAQEAEQKERARLDKRARLLKQVQDGIINGRIRAKMKNGKPAFEGLTASERFDMSNDECLLDVLKKEGSVLVKAKLAIFNSPQAARVTQGN